MNELKSFLQLVETYGRTLTRRQVATLGLSASALAALLFLRQQSKQTSQVLTPPSYPILGNSLEILKHFDDWDDWIYSLTKIFGGKSFQLTAPGKPIFHCFTSPEAVAFILKDNFDGFEKGAVWRQKFHELLGNGIFSADGELWRVQRKSISHIFNVRNFRDLYVQVFIDEIHKFHKVLSKAADNGDIIDLHDLLHRYSLETFTIIGFGFHLNLTNNPTKEADDFCAAFNKAQRIVSRRFIIPTAPLEEFFLGQKKELDQSIAAMDKLIFKFIHERRNDPRKDEYEDLLSRFMGLKDENGEPLNDQTLRDFIMNMLIAGRDTTAEAMAWTMFLALKNPETIAKLRKEATEKLDKSNPTYEQIQDLTYTHAAFLEGLRLHPSVPADSKMAVHDVVFPDGTTVRKGEWVSWFPYAMGRLESIWGPDATEFKPERWLISNNAGKITVKQENPFKYPVFNAGPRNCLGMNMAILEGKVTLAMMISEFDIEVLEHPPVVPDKSLTHLMKYGMSVRVKRVNQTI